MFKALFEHVLSMFKASLKHVEMKLNKRDKKILLIAGAGAAAVFLYSQIKKANKIEFSPRGIKNLDVSLIQNKLSFIFELGLFNPMDIGVRLEKLNGVIIANNQNLGSFSLPTSIKLEPNQSNTLDLALSIPLTSLITGAAQIISDYTQGNPIGVDIEYAAVTNLGTFRDTYSF